MDRGDCGHGVCLGMGTSPNFGPGASGAAKFRGQEQSLCGFCGGDSGLGELPGDAGRARRVCTYYDVLCWRNGGAAVCDAMWSGSCLMMF